MSVLFDLVDRVAVSAEEKRQYPAKELLMNGGFLHRKDLHIREFPDIPDNLGLILPNCAVVTAFFLGLKEVENDWIGIYHPLMRCVVVTHSLLKDLAEGEILFIDKEESSQLVSSTGIDLGIDGGEGF